MSRRTKSTITASLTAALLLSLAPAKAAAQETAKPLFRDYVPWLCVGGAFVAMVGLQKDAPLVIIRIGSKGIEAPQTIPLTGNEVRGLQCSGGRAEVLAWEGGSHIPSVLPFTVGYFEIYNEPRVALDWPNSQRARMPADIQHKVDTFDWAGSRAGGWIHGDWYVWIPRVPDRPYYNYELHYISTRSGGVVKLIVTLLEETKGKVTQSVPLVHIEAADVND